MIARLRRRGIGGMLLASLTLVLAGCSSQPARTAKYDPACEQEASNDPQVQALRAQAGPGAGNSAFTYSDTTPRQAAQDAYRQAVFACMQRRGLTLPGGVEPVKRYPYSFFGF